MSGGEEALPQRPPRVRPARAAAALPAGSKRERDAADDGGAEQDRAAEAPPSATVAWREVEDAEQSFEYLDHTADIQLHAWGASVEEAFGWTALCMFNYMTPLSGFAEEELTTTHVFAVPDAHDMQSLLFGFLDELLYVFSTENFVVRQLELGEIDREHWRVKVTGRGCRFVPGRHEQGTEVKAITYSAMQIREGVSVPGHEAGADIFVIVDI